MGGTVSKNTLTTNVDKLTTLNEEITNLISGILEKYGEFVHDDIKKYYEDLQLSIANNTQPPQLPSFQMFNDTCRDNIVMSFGTKLKKFPKWVLEKKGGFLGINQQKKYANLNPKPDNYNLTKSELCESITNFYMDVLELVENVSFSLFHCQNNMEIIAKKKLVNAADTKANKLFFQKMNELQKVYQKQALKMKKFFKKLANLKELDEKSVTELTLKIKENINNLAGLPGKCKAIFNQLDNAVIIDENTHRLCMRLKIPGEKCSLAEIDRKKAELDTSDKQKDLERETLFSSRIRPRTQLSSEYSPLNRAKDLTKDISQSVRSGVREVRSSLRGGARKCKLKKKKI